MGKGKGGGGGGGGGQNQGAPVDTGCKYGGCRKSSAKYGFCSEHFDWFKFGLVNKHGEHVPDFDKKFDHFMRQKSKVSAAKHSA